MGDWWVKENRGLDPGPPGVGIFSVAAFSFLCFILRKEKFKRIVERDRRKAIESSRPDSFLPIR
jgi:hypothetical protein